METVRHKMKRIKVKAETVREHTESEETALWMDEIIALCKNVLKATDEIATAANVIKYLIR